MEMLIGTASMAFQRLTITANWISSSSPAFGKESGGRLKRPVRARGFAMRRPCGLRAPWKLRHCSCNAYTFDSKNIQYGLLTASSCQGQLEADQDANRDRRRNRRQTCRCRRR